MSGVLPSRRFREAQLLIGAALVMLVAVSVAVLEGMLALARALEGEVRRTAAVAAGLQGSSPVAAVNVAAGVTGGLTFADGQLVDAWGESGPTTSLWWPWASQQEWEGAGRPVAGPLRLGDRYVVVVYRLLDKGRVVRTVVDAPAAGQAWRWRWLGGTLALLVAGGGGLLAWLLIARSLAPYRELLAEAGRVTGRSGVEAEDRFLVETFRSTVRRMEESERALRQRAEDLGMLSAGLAHEIRNALATITGYLRLLPEAGEEKRAQYIATANDEASGLVQLLDRFLTLTQPHTLALAPVRLDEVVREAARRVNVSFPGAQFVINDAQVTVDGDAMTLGIAAENLLRNAAEATGSSSAAIEVRIEANEEAARVAVADRGPGVGDEIRDTLFLPFSSTKPSGGLGLALARRFCRLHGGDVRYEPRPGGGALFILEVPLRRAL